MVPVQRRVVEEQLDALLLALLGQHRQDVLLVRRAVDDVVVGHLRVEHGEAVVVLRGDRDVLDAGPLDHRDPLGGVELRRVEPRRELLVLGDGDLLVVHHPFALAQDAVDAPVDEHAELGVLEPSHGVGIGLLGRLGPERPPERRPRQTATDHRAGTFASGVLLGRGAFGGGSLDTAIVTGRRGDVKPGTRKGPSFGRRSSRKSCLGSRKMDRSPSSQLVRPEYTVG